MNPQRIRLHQGLWWWRAHLGWPGAVALAALLLSLLLAAWVRPSIDGLRKAQLHTQVKRIEAASKARQTQAVVANSRDPRDEWLAQVPPWGQRGQTIATLLKVSTQSAIPIERADYDVKEQAPGLLRVQVDLPVQASYAQLRGMVTAVLNALPHAAVDHIEAERGLDDAAPLKAHIKLSLFFRSEAP